MSVEQNLQVVRRYDDAWNSRDWETFKRCHAENVTVHWPGRPAPTMGREAHLEEALEFVNTFPDSRLKTDPYDAIFGQDDWTCTVTEVTGTMSGPMQGLDGRMIPPTYRTFTIPFCVVARWENAEIVEERLFFDPGEMMAQLGLGEEEQQAA